MELLNIQMVIIMKAIGFMIKNKVKENYHFLIKIYILVNLRMMLCKIKEKWFMKMVIFMKVSFSMEWQKVKEFKSFIMEINMKENLKKIKEMDMENLLGQTVTVMKEHFKMI